MRVILNIPQDQITATVRFKTLNEIYTSILINLKFQDYLQTVDSVAEFDLRHLGTSRLNNMHGPNEGASHGHELSSDSDHDHVSLQDHSDMHTIVDIQSKYSVAEVLFSFPQ